MNMYYNQPYGYGYGGMMQPFNQQFMGPSWGYPGPGWQYPPIYPAPGAFGGLGGLRRHGGSYSPQYTGTGLPTDEEITEMIYDAMDVDPLIPYDADIDVTVDAGEVTLAGTVMSKDIKHAAGDDAWWIPGVTDVHNQLQVSGQHRTRQGSEKRPQRGMRAQRR